MDCSPPGSSVHGDSPGRNTEVGSHSLLQGIFPTQRLVLGLLHCRQILYWLGHQGHSRGDSGCMGGELNLDLPSGRQESYHWTAPAPLHLWSFIWFVYFLFWPFWISLLQGLSLAKGSRASSVVVCSLLWLGSMHSRACGPSSCGAQASLPGSMWGLPGPGTELMSPILEDGPLTAGSPGKFLALLLWLIRECLPILCQTGHMAGTLPTGLRCATHSIPHAQSSSECELSRLGAGGVALSQAGGHMVAGFIVTYQW